MEFLNKFGSDYGWSASTMDRIHAATEETLLPMLQTDQDHEQDKRQLLLNARKQDGRVVLEFVAGSGEENLQGRIALLGDSTTQADVEQKMSLRLLRHFASSVRHQQFHNADIVTVQVAIR